MLPKGYTDEKQCLILMKIDSEEDNIKLAKFVCQLSEKCESIINRQKALLDYVRLITAHFIPISSYAHPYLGPKNCHTAIHCGEMVHTGLLLLLLLLLFHPYIHLGVLYQSFTVGSNLNLAMLQEGSVLELYKPLLEIEKKFVVYICIDKSLLFDF